MQPTVLRKFTRDTLAFYRMLGLRKNGLQFNFLDADWIFRFWSDVKPRSGLLQIDLDWGGAQCRVCLDEAWISQFASAVLGQEYFYDLSEEMRILVIDATFASASNLIETVTRKRLSILSSVKIQRPVDLISEGWSFFGFSLDDGFSTTEGELWFDATGLGFFANAISIISDYSLPLTSFENLLIPIRMALGWVDLDINQLSTIESGDVILLDEYWLEDDNSILLQLGTNCGIRAKIDGKNIVIQDDLEEIMQDVDEYNIDNDSLLDSIKLRLTFDLGEREVLIGELRNISTGYVFEMGRDVRHAVTIRANGRAIGEGELVDIDGLTGVCVLRLNAGIPTDQSE